MMISRIEKRNLEAADERMGTVLVFSTEVCTQGNG
jgi:hypothetical protein